MDERAKQTQFAFLAPQSYWKLLNKNKQQTTSITLFKRITQTENKNQEQIIDKLDELMPVEPATEIIDSMSDTDQIIGSQEIKMDSSGQAQKKEKIMSLRGYRVEPNYHIYKIDKILRTQKNLN